MQTLGMHKVLHPCPHLNYQTKIRFPVTKSVMRKWSQEVSKTLQGCIDWVYCAIHNRDDQRDCLTRCANFCEDVIIPARTVHSFRNSKSCLTIDLESPLNQKKSASRSSANVEHGFWQTSIKVPYFPHEP